LKFFLNQSINQDLLEVEPATDSYRTKHRASQCRSHGQRVPVMLQTSQPCLGCYLSLVT